MKYKICPFLFFKEALVEHSCHMVLLKGEGKMIFSLHSKSFSFNAVQWFVLHFGALLYQNWKDIQYMINGE